MRETGILKVKKSVGLERSSWSTRPRCVRLGFLNRR